MKSTVGEGSVTGGGGVGGMVCVGATVLSAGAVEVDDVGFNLTRLQIWVKII